MTIHALECDAAAIRRWRRILWTAAGLLLLLPLLATAVTDEVDWGPEDFVAMALMLAVAGGLVELGLRISRRRVFVLGLMATVGAGFLLVWADLAVGIIRAS